MSRALTVTLGVAGDHFEFLGFAAQRVDRRFHAGALLRQRGFKRFAFVLQLLHQLVHLGAVFFLAERVRYFHFVWHLFVLTGSVCHYFAVLHYALPRAA